MNAVCANFLKTAAIAMLSALTCQTATARIGENRNAMETRLLSKTNGAYAYTSKEDKLRESQEIPYGKLLFIFPRNVTHNFYFKNADTSLATNSNVIQQHDLFGWELHTCFDKDISVLEFYRRHGDPMTVEELEALMNIMAERRDSKWVKTPYSDLHRRWDFEFKGDGVKAMLRNEKGELIDPEKAETLRDILPINKKRTVYLEIPDDVRKSPNFSKTLRSQLLEIEQRKAYEDYRKLVADQSAYSAARTKRSGDGSVQRINPFDGTTHRVLESTITETNGENKEGENVSIYRFSAEDILYGGERVVSFERGKDVRIPYEIPLQPDTAFGYTYELSDGSLRAKLYRNGVLFFASDFDKNLRDYIEKLYKEQEAERIKNAADSVSKF